MLDELLTFIVGDLVSTAVRRRREHRARERGRVLGVMRLRSGEISGVSARWREINTLVEPARLQGRSVEIQVLGVQRRAKASIREEMMLSSLDMNAVLLEVQTPTSLLDWGIPARDLQWVTKRLGFAIAP